MSPDRRDRVDVSADRPAVLTPGVVREGTPIPKWEQVHHDVMRRIGAGEFADSFPSEVELAQAYAVSRHTVREALRRLRDHGVLDSSRGRLTRVRPRPIEAPLGGLYSLFNEVEAQGHVQRSDVLTLAMVRDTHAAHALQVPSETELFHLERLRRCDGEPLAYDRVWLRPEVGRPLLGSDFGRAALYDELLRCSGVRPTGGRERITAIVPDTEQRERLGLTPAVACFEVERWGRVREQPPMEYRVTLVRADRYELVTQWSPEGIHMGGRTPVP